VGSVDEKSCDMSGTTRQRLPKAIIDKDGQKKYTLLKELDTRGERQKRKQSGEKARLAQKDEERKQVAFRRAVLEGRGKGKKVEKRARKYRSEHV